MSKLYSKFVEIEKLFARGIEPLKCTCAASQQTNGKGLADFQVMGNPE
jgi:hypothetical protein